MKIEVWSDVVCPWCYIGKRRLEDALSGFEHRDEVEVSYRSFQLDPTAPEAAPGAALETVADHLAQVYGADNVARMMTQVATVAEGEGLEFHQEGAPWVNTRVAHRLLQTVRTAAPEVAPRLEEALMHAYFTEQQNIGDPDVLVAVAAELGLDEAMVRAALADTSLDPEVDADVAQAREFGASGVPFFVFDRRFAIAGAQPTEVFAQALRQTWDAAHPALVDLSATGRAAQDGAAQDGAVCGPEGCTD